MNIEYGDIYQIFNTETRKSYIGQSKHFSRRGVTSDGDIRYEKRGWRVRVREHFQVIRNNNPKACPKLAASVRKYGASVFVARKLETCHLVDLDDREVWWIRIFNSFNNGYNASPGGGNFVLEEDRDKINELKRMLWFDPKFREHQLECKYETRLHDLPSNIVPYFVDGTLCGYKVRIIRKGHDFSKVYGNGYDISLIEKLQLAIQWRDEFISLTDDLNELSKQEMIQLVKEWDNQNHKFNPENQQGTQVYSLKKAPKNEKKLEQPRPGREYDLPANIYVKRKNKQITGYSAEIKHNGVRYTKSFACSNVPMEIKLKAAIEWRDKKIAELSNNS